MNELDELLRSLRPREPSPGYFDKGLARIDASRAPLNLFCRRWRFATISLAILFAASLGLNILNWMEERRAATYEARLVFSDLRRQGDILVRETRYELPGTAETAND